MAELRSSEPGGIPDELLECLILFPSGTVGEQQERELVKALNNLCKVHGYGRVPQLAKQIEEIWRDPAYRVRDYKARKKDHLKFMEQCSKADK